MHRSMKLYKWCIETLISITVPYQYFRRAALFFIASIHDWILHCIVKSPEHPAILNTKYFIKQRLAFDKIKSLETYFEEKILEHLSPTFCEINLRMELHTIHFLCLVINSCKTMNLNAYCNILTQFQLTVLRGKTVTS